MALFQHEDDDGDALEVSGTEETEYDPRYHLLFTATRSSGRASSCALDMEALKRLHSLLGEWLYPHHRAEEPNLTLIEKMVAKAVKEQVSAVLPLHLSPVTIVGESNGNSPCKKLLRPGTAMMDRCQACGYLWITHRTLAPEPDADDARLCELEDCSLFEGTHFEHDPEPQEVGHPVKPHFPSVHLSTEADCKANDCIAARHLPEPAAKPRLMAEMSRRQPELAATWDDRLFQGVTPFCDECDHVWSRHSVALGKCNVRVNGVHCGCNVLERRHS